MMDNWTNNVDRLTAAFRAGRQLLLSWTQLIIMLVRRSLTAASAEHRAQDVIVLTDDHHTAAA